MKDRLRIQNDVEDDDLELMMASATAFIEEYIGRPIAATARTWMIESPNPEWRSTRATRLFLPLWPVLHEEDSSGDGLVTITDADGDAVTDFRVNTQTGMIVATGGTAFRNFPYTVTAMTGLDLLPGYATRVEPNLAQAFLDLIADWYQRRSPGAFMEGAGGGVVTQWMGTGTGGMESVGTPARALDFLKMYRLVRVG